MCASHSLAGGGTKLYWYTVVEDSGWEVSPTTVDELDASVAETVESKQRHILARSELRALSDEVMQLVGILDGINRYRFAREPQLLAAWDRAKHVVGGSQVEAPASTPEVPGGPAAPTGPESGEVKPAA